MDFYEVIRTRRSVRSFKKKQIPEEVLNRVLEAARVAPSGGNRQPWKFILIKDETLKQKMASACNNQRFIADAPLIVVACGQKLPINRGGYMGEMSTLLDVSIAFTSHPGGESRRPRNMLDRSLQQQRNQETTESSRRIRSGCGNPSRISV